jgi:hypothetical protein
MINLHRPLGVAVVALVLASACQPETVEPSLAITLRPRTIDNRGQVATVSFSATDKLNKSGKGTVRLSSPMGSFREPVSVELESGGTASAEFSCNVTQDPACTGGPVRISASWTTDGAEVTAATTVTVAPVVPDGGMMLTASRTQLGIGLSQRADLVATYLVDGTPAASAAVTLTTTLGALVLPDGGAFVSPATTDVAGQVRAVLVDNGIPGMATVTATGPTGTPASASVNVYVPDAGITLAATPDLLRLGFNEASAVTVGFTLEGRAVAGRLIQLESTAGRLLELDGGAFVSPASTNGQGEVKALLRDMGAPGAAVLTATEQQSGKSASTTVTFALPDAGVFIMTEKPRIYVGIGDSTGVTARLVTNDAPAPGRTLNVTTTGGRLVQADGGTFSGSGITDAQGAVELRLTDLGVEGPNTVLRATDPQTGKQAATTVDILRIGAVTYTDTTCNGVPCVLMGLRNSGFNTQAAVRFNVRDARSPAQPVPGARVTFALNNAPSGTTVTASAVTDALGNADAIVTSGNSIGSYTVTATVAAGISASSPTIGVRGARPATLQFTCTKVNMAAFRSQTPPLSIRNDCNIILQDRNNNPIGTGTPVQFLAEAGNIPSSANTQAFVPNTPNMNEGRGTLTFDSAGRFFGAVEDVAPLPAAATQFPSARFAEPSYNDGPITRNPRDTLVTLVAYTDGEEWFSDDNANGVCDPGEQFIDQGEPFIDRNDNDIREVGEFFIDSDGNNAYSPPNGVWDSSAKIWTKTFVLYTDASAAAQSFFTDLAGTPVSTFNVPKGESLELRVFMPDQNLNRIEQGSTMAVAINPARGTVVPTDTLNLDGYGFGVDARVLLNAAGDGPCASSTPVCRYFTRFTSWGRGEIGRMTITGLATTDMTMCTGTPCSTVTASTTVRGAVVSKSLAGTIQ